MATIQMTLTTKKGANPINVKMVVKGLQEYLNNKAIYKQKALAMISNKTGLTVEELQNQGYTEMQCTKCEIHGRS